MPKTRKEKLNGLVDKLYKAFADLQTQIGEAVDRLDGGLDDIIDELLELEEEAK